MTTLWIEPFGGLAGDMLLAALLDLGDPRFALPDLAALAEDLVPGEARLSVEEVWRGSLRGLALTVETPESARPPHRGLRDLLALLDASSLSPGARSRAAAALTVLAEAEARVHAAAVEDVHFHEVGAVDTLIDVGGAALALERLGVLEVRASPPLVGSGTVTCAHGEMPVPAPAVAELLRGRAVLTGGGCERTTPTAAALLAAWTAEFVAPEQFRAAGVGYGAGRADPTQGPPNLARVQLGEEGAAWSGPRAEAWLLEINLDDQPAEEIGHALGELRAAGALEVWTSPAHMKKDRPGVVVSALARGADRARLERAAFDWTTTFGLRWTRVERAECGRGHVAVELDGREVRVKLRERPGAPLAERDLFPEHDDLAHAARALGVTLGELRRRAVERAWKLVGGAASTSPGSARGASGAATPPDQRSRT